MHIGNRIFAICDAEREYAFRFMEHLRRKQNLSFQIRVFTDPEKLITFAQKTPLDILLISERSMTDAVAGLAVKKLIILSERTGGGRSGFSYPSLYKYQSTDVIVREIMNSYGADVKREGGRDTGKKNPGDRRVQSDFISAENAVFDGSRDGRSKGAPYTVSESRGVFRIRGIHGMSF